MTMDLLFEILKSWQKKVNWDFYLKFALILYGSRFERKINLESASTCSNMLHDFLLAFEVRYEKKNGCRGKIVYPVPKQKLRSSNI